jgi:hypothetical protein
VIEALLCPKSLRLLLSASKMQEGGEFFVHPHHGILGVGTQHVMAILSSLQHAG